MLFIQSALTRALLSARSSILLKAGHVHTFQRELHTHYFEAAAFLEKENSRFQRRSVTGEMHKLEIKRNEHIQQNGSGNGKPDHKKSFLSGPAPEHEDA